jgi:CubicO group peptidase (beta-lactamase class C family)
MTDSLARILPLTTSVIRSGEDRGLHSGFQIYVSLNGEAIVDAACGDAQPGVPMTTYTILPWLSAGKPLAAVAILLLVEKRLLDLDTTIASLLPEFGVGGKESVTLRHLLTHTGGFRNVESGWPHSPWQDVISRICAAPIEDSWTVGRTADYHPSSSWYILGELIEQLDGRPWPQFLKEEICDPLNLCDTWNAISETTWQERRDRIAPLSQRDRGRVEPLPWHDSTHCQQPSPGVSTRGPVRQLGQFYEWLGGVSTAPDILSSETKSLMTRRHREAAFDKTLCHKVDFGLGVILNSNRYGVETVPYGFGRFCSEDTFGHGGSQSSIGFADPKHGLVVAWVANTRAGEGQHQKRNREINSAIYKDLGLVQTQDSK